MAKNDTLKFGITTADPLLTTRTLMLPETKTANPAACRGCDGSAAARRVRCEETA